MPDFMWRAQRLIVEVDSAKYHRTQQRYESGPAARSARARRGLARDPDHR